jgi:glucose-6-phosphate isomerase
VARRDVSRGKINITEGRAAFHMALRAPKGSVMRIDGHDVVPDVHAVLDHMGEFARRLRDGTWRDIPASLSGTSSMSASAVPISDRDGLSGVTLIQRPVDDIPLRRNVDGAAFDEATRDLDASETLFIVASKTFTTLETMCNAATARN